MIYQIILYLKSANVKLSNDIAKFFLGDLSEFSPFERFRPEV